MLRVMKAERLEQLLGEGVWDEVLLPQISRETFELLLRYILSAGIDKKAFEIRVDSIRDIETRSKAMTLAQQYHQEGLIEGLTEGLTKGRQKGFLEGVLKSRRQDVVEALEIRFGTIPDWISSGVNGIEDEKKLKFLHRSAIQSASLEEFVQSL